jgi:transcriptional regulator with XRE-family HTH domain
VGQDHSTVDRLNATAPAERWTPSRIGALVAMHRNRRKMRVSELARAVGVTPSLISQIERGSTRPSVATLFALAEALDVSVDVFADRAGEGEAPEPAPRAGRAPAARPARESRYVVRRVDRRSIAIDGGIRWELLSPETEPEAEFLEIVYEPHAESSPTLYRHPGKELVRVIAGAFEIHIGFDVFRLEEGDSIVFPASLPHRYVNPTDSVSSALTVIVLDAEAERLDAPRVSVAPRPAGPPS